MTHPFLPIELVFNPNWWYQTAGISFEEDFYLQTQTRIANDVTMRRVLHQRYGDLGLGEADPQPRPVIGSLHVAGGLCINMDYGTPDDNIWAVAEVAERYRRAGG